MHVAMSDLLVCPRCGPEWGLVLIPDEVRDRRVVRGTLGCPECRGRYVVSGGVADLRLEGAGLTGGPPWRPGDGSVRLAALLGLAERRGVVFLAGPAAWHGSDLAELVSDVEVVAAPSSSVEGVPAGVSVVDVGERIPLRTGSVHGVALTGDAVGLVAEAARVLGPGSRLLVDPADEAVREAVVASGLRVVATEGAVVVAVR